MAKKGGKYYSLHFSIVVGFSKVTEIHFNVSQILTVYGLQKRETSE